MAKNPINWGLIQSGATFQSLVNTIIFFKYPHAKLFGRPGKDGGQDAQAGNIVFQAKFHQAGTPDVIRNDATSELEKIKKYKAPGHKNEFLWQEINQWILVTNVYFNPYDDEKWKNQIVPEFAKVGLDASEYWSGEKLEAFLTEYPEIYRAYFEAENRIFLSLPEVREALLTEEIGNHILDLDMVGRDQELEESEQFLSSDQRILLIHGPGGIGKSRLLFEIGARAGEQGWEQIFWAHVETMAKESRWYEAIIPERKTLVLIDEPTQPELIKVILEQISTSRLAQWKIIIATRTSKDPVLTILHSVQQKRNIIKELPIKSLAREDARTFALKLLQASFFNNFPTEQLGSIAAQIAKRFDGFPIWIVLAVKLFEQKRNLNILPEDVSELLKDYFGEILEFHQNVIRWVALYEKIYSSDNQLLEFIERLPDLPRKSQIIRYLSALAEKGFLSIRTVSKQRLYKIKPDFMRDYVLREWLTLPNGTQRCISGEAEELTDLIMEGYQGNPLPKIEIVLKSLARAELLENFSNSPVPLLDPIIKRLKEMASKGSTLDQLDVITYLPFLSFARTSDSIEIIKSLRRTSQRPEDKNYPLFGTITVSHDQIIAKLAWQLFLVSEYTFEAGERKQIIQEMCQLVLDESRLPKAFYDKLKNDGQRAQSLLSRIITRTGSQEAFQEGMFQIEQLLSLKPIDHETLDGTLHLLKALLQPQLAVHRMEHDAVNTFLIQIYQYTIPLTGPLGKNRNELRDKLRQVVATDGIDERIKILVWELLSEAHRSANFAIPEEHVSPSKLEKIKIIMEDLINDLEWVRDLLKSQRLSPTEMKSARQIWDWHYMHERMPSHLKYLSKECEKLYDQHPSLKRLAEECEQLYKQHPLVSKFHDLISLDPDEKSVKQKELLSYFTHVKEVHELFEFIEQMAKFIGSNDNRYSIEIALLAPFLGEALPENQVIKEFVFEALNHHPTSLEFWFATIITNTWLKKLRESNQLMDLEQVLHQLIERAKPNQQQLLLSLYGRQYPETVGWLTSFDLAFVESHLDLFSGVDDKKKLFQILGSMYYVNWEHFVFLVEQTLKNIPIEKSDCLVDLLDIVLFIGLFRASRLPDQTQLIWLLNQMLRMPDIDNIEVVRNIHWKIHECVKQVGQLPLSWLIEVLHRRIELDAELESENKNEMKFKIVPMQLNLAELVCPIDAHSAQEPQTRENLEKLLALNNRSDLIGFVLPKYAAQIDPQGFLVPRLVVEKLSSLQDHRELIWWSRYGGYYLSYPDRWCIIAVPACQLVEKLDEYERSKIYLYLGYRQVPHRHGKLYSCSELTEEARAKTEKAKEEFNTETCRELIDYRRWWVGTTQEEYERALEEERKQAEYQAEETQ